MRKISKIIMFVLTLAFLVPTHVSASDEFVSNDAIMSKNEFIRTLQTEKTFDMEKTMISYDPDPKEVTIEKGKTNYINPITKEYFIIEDIATKSGSIAKHFSFDIRVSVTSDQFKISSSNLSTYSTSTMYNNSGNYTNPPYGSTYGIEIKQEWGKSKSVSFPINGTQTSTFGSGWNVNKTARVRIYNDGSFDRYGGYIKGSGVINNN